MSEANCPVRALDHPCGKGRIEYALCDLEAREQLGGRTPHGRREQQRLSCCRRQLVEACAHQSLERLWNAERLRWVDLRTQSPGELERVEGVPTGRLVDTKEGRPWDRSGEVCLEKLVSGPETQRADMQPFHPVGT